MQIDNYSFTFGQNELKLTYSVIFLFFPQVTVELKFWFIVGGSKQVKRSVVNLLECCML